MEKKATSIWPAKTELLKELRRTEEEDEKRRIRTEHAEAVWAELQEELEGLAHAAGFDSREEYINFLNERGDHGIEIVRRLRQAFAESVGEAHKDLYHEAGDEAGAVVDPMNLAFQKKHFWSKPMIRQHREQFDATHPKKKKKILSKEELGKRGSRDFAQYMAQSPEGDDVAHTLFEDTLE